MRARAWVGFALAVFAAACAPDLRDGFYLCASSGGCPDGWTCRLGSASASERRCYRAATGGPAPDAGAPADAADGDGDGGSSDAAAPSPCAEDTPVVELVAGGQHTCARRESGMICCWGQNADGQLGTGASEPSFAPVPVALPEGIVLSRLDAGDRTTCAVDETAARAYCWGAVPDGSGSRRELAPAPLDVEDVAEVAVGGAHVCVRAGAGAPVRCMGRGDSGELGDGGFEHSPSFVEVMDVGVGLDLDTAEQITCVVRTSRNVSCWGLDPGGSVPFDGLPETILRPGEAALGAMEQVVVAAGHRCARGPDAVYCWGNNHLGQVDGQPDPSAFYAIEVPRAARARSVAVGAPADATRGHSCAALDSGVVCWGDNSEGQLGTGDTVAVTEPVRADLPTGGARLVAAGSAHTCALLDDGRALCWGGNGEGQLGRGHHDPDPAPAPALGFGGP